MAKKLDALNVLTVQGNFLRDGGSRQQLARLTVSCQELDTKTTCGRSGTRLQCGDYATVVFSPLAEQLKSYRRHPHTRIAMISSLT